MKVLILDSSTVISLSLNSLLYLLEKLHEGFDGKFVITEQVKREIVEKPLEIKKFELEALMVSQLIKKGVLETPESLGISNKEIKDRTFKILESGNKAFMAREEWIKLISPGETSCFALANILRKKEIEYVLAIDERTARMLSEKPENLQKLLEKKLHTSIKMNKDNLSSFADHKIIRSSEICYIAYKKKLVGIDEGIRLVDAMLYGTKYKGCAISSNEIEEIKKIV